MQLIKNTSGKNSIIELELQTELNVRNKIMAINSLAIPIVTVLAS